VTGILASL